MGVVVPRVKQRQAIVIRRERLPCAFLVLGKYFHDVPVVIPPLLLRDGEPAGLGNQLVLTFKAAKPRNEILQPLAVGEGDEHVEGFTGHGYCSFASARSASILLIVACMWSLMSCHGTS